MPIEIEYEPNDIYVLRISGTLKQSEFAAEQADIARRIDSGSKPRVLVIGEKFEGWERGADWNDLDFSSRMPIKFPRSPSSPSDVGSLSRLLLQERESVARQ